MMINREEKRIIVIDRNGEMRAMITDESKKILAQAVAYDPENSDFNFKGEVIPAMKVIVRESLEIGEELVEGVIEKSADLFEGLLGDFKIKELAAEYYYQKGNYERAAELAEICTEYDCGEVEYDALHLLCMISSDIGEYDEAEEWATELLERIDEFDISDDKKMSGKMNCVEIIARNHHDLAESKYETLVGELMEKGYEDSDVCATAKMNLGWYIIRDVEDADNNLVRIEKALRLMKEAEGIFVKNGEDGENLICCRGFISYAYSLFGDAGEKKSIEYTDKVIAEVDNVFNESNPEYISILERAAYIYHIYGLDKEAKELEVRIEQLT